MYHLSETSVFTSTDSNKMPTPLSPASSSSAREKESDLELQAASPADLAATAAEPDPSEPTKEYLTDVHEIPKNNLWLVFTGVSAPSFDDRGGDGWGSTGGRKRGPPSRTAC